MASVQKIKTKKGIAHRIWYYRSGQHLSEYYGPAIPWDFVRRRLKELEANLALEKLRPGLLAPACSWTLEALRVNYVSSRRHEIDVSRNVFALNLLITHLGLSHRLDAISHHTITRFRDWLLDLRLAREVDPNHARVQAIRRGVNNELRNLKVIFNWAYENDHLATRIFDKVKFLPADESTPDVLSFDEFVRFFAHIHSPNYRFAAILMVLTGLRRIEAVRLKVESINLASGFIHISRSKNRKERFVPIHPILAPVIRAWIDHNHLAPSDNLFLFHDLRQYTRQFAWALERAGLVKKSKAHLLRHTFGHWVISSNPTDTYKRFVRDILGHSSDKMTDHYTQIENASLLRHFSDIPLLPESVAGSFIDQIFSTNSTQQ